MYCSTTSGVSNTHIFFTQQLCFLIFVIELDIQFDAFDNHCSLAVDCNWCYICEQTLTVQLVFPSLFTWQLMLSNVLASADGIWQILNACFNIVFCQFY